MAMETSAGMSYGSIQDRSLSVLTVEEGDSKKTHIVPIRIYTFGVHLVIESFAAVFLGTILIRFVHADPNVSIQT